ncbi:PREDICTED: uncharacterized protein LOC106330894 [Brassica oleracea var. oleracea]|uniref:uncharacterized protein LOC106330894 n=1 Tax=Brassica oleracea var. oleracea TaxID=109376 RepID=UPI0006A71FB6|nr:PREDICTED: uncharacterized protein LOC106330894 [Brassica oleracea var. oleracea]
MEPTGDSPGCSDRKTGKKIIASSATVKPNGKSIASFAIVKTAVSSTIPIIGLKLDTSATTLSSAHADQVMFFRDVSFGPREAELRFRLIHFWEARNPLTKTLIGQEMLLINGEGTAIQGFVPAGRVGTFDLTDGVVYKLSNFFGSRRKVQYRLLIISLPSHSPGILFYRFLRTLRYQFQMIGSGSTAMRSLRPTVTLRVTFMLVNGQTISDYIVLDEVDISEKRHLCVHVQTHDGPVMKLCIWDKAASNFCQKFKSYGGTPSVLLVTTVNPKHIGGTLALATMSSSRVFMDADVQPSKDYLEWLSSNWDIANRVAAEVVTKPEIVTLGEIFSYIKREDSSVALFECTETIDDVVQGSAWYYISCGGCNSKAIKGPTSLICNSKKCGKREVTGVAQYLTKISVYDESEQAVFVVLGDAGKELTGKHASELVASYFESNAGVDVDHCVPVPQALLDAIGQKRRFIVKILPPEAPQPIEHLEEKANPSRGFEDAAGDMVGKASERLESREAKRPKSG